ncbi:MAG: two-component system response regulator [Zetaproteobacteria bacterium]|nr:two-component system response regulator [Pseudobdellovibrionaceae bacterium]
MRKVLLVDDSPVIRTGFKNAFSKSEFECLEAEDGLQGLDAMSNHGDIAVIILDFNMPNMNGMEMLVELDRIGKELPPIFMVTTEYEEEIVKKCETLGVKAWIVKPIDPESLNRIILKYLKTQESKAKVAN